LPHRTERQWLVLHHARIRFSAHRQRDCHAHADADLLNAAILRLSVGARGVPASAASIAIYRGGRVRSPTPAISANHLYGSAKPRELPVTESFSILPPSFDP